MSIGRPQWRAWGSQLHDFAVAREWIHIVGHPVVEGWMRTAGFELVHPRAINILWYGHEVLLSCRRLAQVAA